jgi:hypothetical protein
MAAARGTNFKLSFWPLQLGGWFLYTVAIATSNLPLRHEKELVAFRATFLISAFLASFWMYALCRAVRVRQVAVLPAVVLCMVACAILGLGCSAVAVWSEIYFGGSPFPFHWSSALSGMTGGAFVLIAWCAIYSGIKQYQALEVERERLYAAEVTAREAQLLALRYQVQPHFLFNTLNAISSLVVGNKPELATQMISRLGDLLRSTLDEPDVHFVSLAEELAVVKEYLCIEEIRFGARLRVTFGIPAETLSLQVPRFILQPLVENAIRHGISHLPAGGSLRLCAAREHESVELRIENDVAATRPSPERCAGLGLANTRERVSQIYGSRASVTVRDQPPKNFLVILSLPLYATKEDSEELR